MRKILFVVLAVAAIYSCKNEKKQCCPSESKVEAKAFVRDVQDKSFEDLFVKIEPTDIDYNIFKLLGDDWSIVTAGTETDYNSMIASWGGFGRLFEKPVSWQFLNASRFTLEKINQNGGKYTLSFTDTVYKDQKLFLGSKSGRGSEKMKESKLTPVKTPSGLMAYKESYMIIELQNEGISELNPDNFTDEKDKKFLSEAKESGNGKEYHKCLTSVITGVWIRK